MRAWREIVLHMRKAFQQRQATLRITKSKHTWNDGTPEHPGGLPSPVGLHAKPHACDKNSQHNREVAPSHAPRESRRYRETNVMLLAHPAACHGQEASEKASDNLNPLSACLNSKRAPERQTTAPMACCGLSPKARRVLPVDHADMQDPETDQYPISDKRSTVRNYLSTYQNMPIFPKSASLAAWGSSRGCTT